MAFHCQFCDIRHPEGDTRIIMMGLDFVEFCPACGDQPDMVRVADHPEVTTLNQLFELAGAERAAGG